MKLRFINHSAYLVSHDGVVLFVDPWIEGRVFNNGWELITPTPFSYDEFRDVTHIWFSHEHPDHFNPPNLAKIPLELRKKIVVLFQVSRDKRVVSACNKLGFNEVIELMPDRWLRLAPDLEALCENYAEGDSWLALRTAKHVHLNTNDCGIRDATRAQEIARKVGRPDVLLSQFSYAFWAGNPEQTELRREMALDKLYGLKFQCDHFNAKRVVPMASFIWFSHRENFYLNDLINTPRGCEEYLSKQTSAETVVLYPGDELALDDPHDNRSALARYEADYARVQKSSSLVESEPIEWDTLREKASDYVQNVARNPWARLLLRQPTQIFLWDRGRSCSLDLRNGLTESNLPESKCDAAMSSESLHYSFTFPWGQDTLGVNGRFRKPPGGNYSRFYNYFRFEQLRSRGIEVNLSYLFSVAFRHVYHRLGLERYNPVERTRSLDIQRPPGEHPSPAPDNAD